jgi:RND family efflux transporter MFP subunit
MRVNGRVIRAALLAVVWLAEGVLPATAQQGFFERDFDCLIDAQSRVKLSASVSGLIARIHADRGDRVRAGQVLVELESSVEEAALRAAELRASNPEPVEAAAAKLELARRTLDRLTRLRASNPGALTQVQMDQAQIDMRVAESNHRDARFSLDAAKLEADRARALLQQRRIASPVDGVVVERLMSTGEYRHEQAQFMTLARIDPLNVEVFVPVAMFGGPKLGATATVRPEEPVGGSYKAEITVIDRVIDAASGTFGVRLRLANPQLVIPAGLRCRIRFDRP